jgi:hypothetical protein
MKLLDGWIMGERLIIDGKSGQSVRLLVVKWKLKRWTEED